MALIPELIDDAKFIFRYRKREMARQKKLDQKAPKVGDLAPDFTLSDVSDEYSVTLSDFRGEKPVVLVFGSYT